MFTLQTSCCGADVARRPDPSGVMHCPTCGSLLSATVRSGYSVLVTPCCVATPRKSPSGAYYECSAPPCASAFDARGLLIYMDMKWAHQEGLDYA